MFSHYPTRSEHASATRILPRAFKDRATMMSSNFHLDIQNYCFESHMYWVLAIRLLVRCASVIHGLNRFKADCLFWYFLKLGLATGLVALGLFLTEASIITTARQLLFEQTCATSSALIIAFTMAFTVTSNDALPLQLSRSTA